MSLGVIVMSKQIGKKARRRIILISIFTLIIMLTIVTSIGKVWLQIIAKRQEEKFLREEIVRLKREEDYLRNEVQKLQDPDYVARYAREKFLYSRDGEFTIRIP
jgi:cell division protein DivIC